MVQIVHLEPGRQPAHGERFILIERCSPGGRTRVMQSAGGILVKVPAPFLKAELAAFSRMAEEAGIPKLYVKGALEDEQRQSRTLVSPWTASTANFRRALAAC